jgi:predicted ArsR family transcriptional regulator
VLRILRASSVPMSIIDIADVLGVHPNTVRFHLDGLVGEGQVEQVETARRGPGRPPLMFRAVRQMDRGGTRHYKLLAEILSMGFASDADASAKAQAAGRAWGQKVEAKLDPPQGPVTSADDAVERLVDVLDELGFAPEVRTYDGEKRVGLRHCPFLELAETGSRVVCPIHLGLMQGALETWAAPVTVDRLDPFVEPDLCLAHLKPVGAGR